MSLVDLSVSPHNTGSLQDAAAPDKCQEKFLKINNVNDILNLHCSMSPALTLYMYDGNNCQLYKTL